MKWSYDVLCKRAACVRQRVSGDTSMPHIWRRLTCETQEAKLMTQASGPKTPSEAAPRLIQDPGMTRNDKGC